jgi:cysteine desulfurase / selenocysteine lyase
MLKSVSGMTTRTLIGETVEIPEAPAGLPDVATLARMANAFFSALPGTTDALGAAVATQSSVPAVPEPNISELLAASNVVQSAGGPVFPDAVSRAHIPRGGFGAAAPGGPSAPVPSGGLSAAAPYGPSAPVPSGGLSAPAPSGPSASVLRSGLNAPAPGRGLTAPAQSDDLSAPVSGVSLSAPVSGGGHGAPILGRSLSAPTSGTSPGALPGPAVAASPFYFLDYAGSGWERAAGSAADTLSNLPALAAQSASLPSGVDLLALRTPPSVPSALPSVAPLSGPPSFYFLESTSAASDVPGLKKFSRHPAFDVAAVRRDFPILAERINGRPLIWLDNAATTQKPQAVLDRLTHFYAHENSNIHRAAHELAARATDAYESARATVQRFLGASSPQEIVFVRGATEAINLVAQSWGRQNILPGDEIVVSHLEHHANIVPWQQLVSEKGARLRVIPVDDSGQILLDEYQKLLNSRTRLVSIAHVSNALGTIVPVREVSDLAHRIGARVLIDGAQAVSHMPVDVQALGADFYVFSGHKIFGPTGIGVLYGTAEVLESMPPWQGGGNMISSVTFERTTYQKPPARFEAGTGNIADAAGLGAALDYVTRIGMPLIDRYEHDLLVYATDALRTVPGLRLIGTAQEKASVLSFVLEGHDPVAVGTALNQEGIAVRAGHHCAEPILRRFGVSATVRPSLAFYNTCEEVDTLAAALHRIVAGAQRS